MLTYVLLNVIFFGVVLVILLSLIMPRNVRHILITIGILLIFTAVFDSFIVSLGIVAYDHTKLLGLSIGSAPIEDFFYAILAGFMIPLLWKLTGRYDKKR